MKHSNGRLGAGAAFLASMAKGSRRRANGARALKSERELKRQALERQPARRLRLSEAGFDVIAEVKFRSPANAASVGYRHDPQEAVRRARVYADGGACAISVLTEPFAFRGSLEHLRRVAESSRVPVMRKDFLVDTYQVWEARANGADAVLIVLRIVSEARVEELLDACADAGMFALIEAFDEEDLARANEIVRHRRDERMLIGVNNRDLTDLTVDVRRCLRMASELSTGAPAVAESGLETGSDAFVVAQHAYGLALIGSALMRSDDAGRLIRSFLRSGRRGRERATCRFS